MNWQNKTVWITGASSGIGEALTYQLSGTIASVVVEGTSEVVYV